MKNFILNTIYKSLRHLAIKKLSKHSPRIIAITGSVGKTSTKEALLAVLQKRYGENVRANYGNLNAEIGVPLTILGYRKLPNKFFWPLFLLWLYVSNGFNEEYPSVLILEMGVEKPGDIDYLTSIAKPDISIITAASLAHTANFESVRQMQEEKAKLGLLGNVLIYNGDDKFLRDYGFPSGIGYGFDSERNQYVATDFSVSIDGNSYNIIAPDSKLHIDSKMLGVASVYSQLPALIVGSLFNIPKNEIVSTLSNQKPYPGRMNILEGRRGITIMDDTYNANPASVKAALETLSQIDYHGRKVAILGNMNELGDISSEMHREVGTFARDRCDQAVFVGENANAMAEGYDKEDAIILTDTKDLLQGINDILEDDDLVLLKASQNNNYFEEVAKKLLLDQDCARENLVRQTKFWIKKKQKNLKVKL